MNNYCTSSNCDIDHPHVHTYFNGNPVTLDEALTDWKAKAIEIQMKLDAAERELAAKDAELKACIESHRRQDLKCEALEERLNEKERDY